MKINLKYMLLSLVLMVPACKPGTDSKEDEVKIVKVWLIGDSTMTDYSKDKDYKAEKYPKTGWGQVFQPYMSGSKLEAIKPWIKADSVVIDNRARGGRSTRSFFEEGRWREVYDSLKPGDFVFIQFGHNDASKKKVRRYVDTIGYKHYLTLYVEQTRLKGATPLLITPVARNYPWEKNILGNVHGLYHQGMLEVAALTNTELIDLTQLSMSLFTEKGREFVSSHYFMNLPAGVYEAFPEGEHDNTHFQPEGADEVAQLVYAGLKVLADKQTEE